MKIKNKEVLRFLLIITIAIAKIFLKI